MVGLRTPYLIAPSHSTPSSHVPVVKLLECFVDTVRLIMSHHTQYSRQTLLLLLIFFLQTDCKNGDVRLVGGSKDTEGTVEVCFENLWGLVADGGFDEKDASVICKLLGHSPDCK